MDDEEVDDEEEPLLAEARRSVEHTLDANKIRKFSFRGLPWIIVLCCLQVVLVRAETALQFPYLRSLQRCKSHTTSHEWSGSDFCADRVIVTRLAQAEAGYVQGVGMVVHCISLPFLGWVGDRIGRKPLVVLNFVGLLLEALLNTLVQRIDVLFLAVSIQMATNGLTPALLAMIADGTHPDERVSAYLLCMLAAVPAYALMYLGVTHFVLAEHLRSYEHPWAALALLALFGLVVAILTPETLKRDRLSGAPGAAAPDGAAAAEGGSSDVDEGDGSKAAARSPEDGVRVCSPLVLLARCCGGLRGKGPSPPRAGMFARLASAAHGLCAPCDIAPLRFLMLLEGPMLIALAAFSTLDGFALIAYSWEQETMYYVRLATLPSCGLAVVSSIFLMRDSSIVGPLRTLQLGLVLLLLSLFVMCFAQWHTSLLLLGLMLCAGVTLGLLPALKLLAAQVAHDQQAAATATILAVANGSRAIGLAMHAYVFEEAAAHGVLNATFVLGMAAATIALLVAVIMPPPAEAWKLRAVPGADEEARARRDD